MQWILLPQYSDLMSKRYFAKKFAIGLRTEARIMYILFTRPKNKLNEGGFEPPRIAVITLESALYLTFGPNTFFLQWGATLRKCPTSR